MRPTEHELEAAGLVELTDPLDIDEAAVNGWPLRSFNALTRKFPPIGTVYVSKNWQSKKPAPILHTFTAKQTGPNQVTVSWSGFSPIELSRDGTDTSGSGPWNTGPLTNEPTEGSFAFDYLVQGDTYLFTATVASGASPSVFCAVTAPPLPTLGMNGGGLTWGGNAASNEAAFSLMKELGAKFVRIARPWNYSSDPSWLGFYNADGSFNENILAECNSTAALAATYGLTILWLVDGLISLTEPASGAACYTPGLPYLPTAYAAAVAWLAAGVKGAHVELVNEPDGFGTWKGPVALSAETFALTLPAVYAKAKAADPTCVIHMAPMSGVDQDALSWRVAFAAALPNFAEYLDYDGWHFYTYPNNQPPSTMAGLTEIFIAQAKVTKQSWVTESGFPSLTTNSGDGNPEMTPELQSTYLTEMIQLVVGVEPVEAFFIYCLSDYGAGSDAGYWGLVDSTYPDGDTNPKPSFAAIQAMFA